MGSNDTGPCEKYQLLTQLSWAVLRLDAEEDFEIYFVKGNVAYEKNVLLKALVQYTVNFGCEGFEWKRAFGS